MESHSGSVYNLITRLCEKIAAQNAVSASIIKKLRSKSYEILLSKAKLSEIDDDGFDSLQDPLCSLLIWQFTLITEYNQPHNAKKLQDSIDKLEKLKALKDSTVMGLLQVLLKLRTVSTTDTEIIQTTLSLDSVSSLGSAHSFSSNSFRLFDIPTSNNLQLKDHSFHLMIDGRKYCKSCPVSKESLRARSSNCLMIQDNIPSCSYNKEVLHSDEGYESPTNALHDVLDIWEIASHSLDYNRHTWETLRNPAPEKELPFLSESGAQSCPWIQHVKCNQIYLENFLSEESSVGFSLKLIPKAQFIKDVKYLLVGMASNTFIYNDNEELSLVPGVCIEGVTPEAMNSYCKDLIFCGLCYKALNKMCTSDPYTQKYEHAGYIFTELCESVKRYLSYYRVAALAVPDSSNPLALHQHAIKLSAHLGAVASVCKVGPFTESENIPHGVALLNYLYQNVVSLTNKDVRLVLFSILYPCCQVYFSRFLLLWLMEGTLNDPYEEFFINCNPKYLSTRGRTHWTRSYTLREDIVPDFLTDLRTDILNCGKAMNLLKLCVPNSQLCVYLMGKKPPIISCCFTSEQLLTLEKMTTCYYLEASASCGPRFSLSQIIAQSHEQDEVFMSLLAKKRALTLQRLELERLKQIEKVVKKKEEDRQILKLQYDAAIQQKQTRLTEELEQELRMVAIDRNTEELREKLIQEEAIRLIEYYNKLFETSEKRKENIEKHIQSLKRVHLENVTNEQKVGSLKKASSEIELNLEKASESELNRVPDGSPTKSTCSIDSYVSLHEYTEDKNSEYETDVSSYQSLDVINANADGELNKIRATVIENFEAARRNKAKVIAVEMGINFVNLSVETPFTKIKTDNLTDAQKNRLKVLSTEYNIHVGDDNYNITKPFEYANPNKKKNMTSNLCFNFKDSSSTVCDNLNYINKNMVGNANADINAPLTLHLNTISVSSEPPDEIRSPNFEFDKPCPMSVDSTPHSSACSPTATCFFSVDRSQCEFPSLPTTAATDCTDEGFSFPKDGSKAEPVVRYTSFSAGPVSPLQSSSKRVSEKEAEGVLTNSSKLFLERSVSIPLCAHTKLIHNELLKYFVNDLRYLEHLNDLQRYYFLLDGEYARNLTDGLFEKLYDVGVPVDLINCRTLQLLVYRALDSSSKFQDGSDKLSFKINNVPRKFDLGDPDVLNCLSLSYKVGWPLNVLFPSDAIAKYDEVFKYLLKLHRISWVLKKIFRELKSLTKQVGQNHLYLSTSYQFARLHQCRHVMTHFIQTLQNYVVGEVLHPTWNMLEKNLSSATNIDQLYALHTSYIKNVLFLCLLNQRSAPILKVIQRIFVVILKFYDYLRSQTWELIDGAYVHPNFNKLEDIFCNFEDFVLYLFKIGQKVVKSGYQPHLMQLLDMLDVNGYYTKRNVVTISYDAH